MSARLHTLPNRVLPRIHPITSSDSLDEFHSPSVVLMLVYGFMSARLHTLPDAGQNQPACTLLCESLITRFPFASGIVLA